jgi:hypothetical protein
MLHPNTKCCALPSFPHLPEWNTVDQVEVVGPVGTHHLKHSLFFCKTISTWTASPAEAWTVAWYLTTKTGWRLGSQTKQWVTEKFLQCSEEAESQPTRKLQWKLRSNNKTVQHENRNTPEMQQVHELRQATRPGEKQHHPGCTFEPGNSPSISKTRHSASLKWFGPRLKPPLWSWDEFLVCYSWYWSRQWSNGHGRRWSVSIACVEGAKCRSLFQTVGTIDKKLAQAIPGTLPEYLA